MKRRIYLSSPHMGNGELENVKDAFATNWVAPAGPYIQQFENDLANYCGTAAAAVVQSGTAAIHLALRLLGVGPSDKILCQSLTFVGSSNPILYEKAEPVFVDSEKETCSSHSFGKSMGSLQAGIVCGGGKYQLRDKKRKYTSEKKYEVDFSERIEQHKDYINST